MVRKWSTSPRRWHSYIRPKSRWKPKLASNTIIFKLISTNKSKKFVHVSKLKLGVKPHKPNSTTSNITKRSMSTKLLRRLSLQSCHNGSLCKWTKKLPRSCTRRKMHRSHGWRNQDDWEQQDLGACKQALRQGCDWSQMGLQDQVQWRWIHPKIQTSSHYKRILTTTANWLQQDICAGCPHGDKSFFNWMSNLHSLTGSSRKKYMLSNLKFILSKAKKIKSIDFERPFMGSSKLPEHGTIKLMAIYFKMGLKKAQVSHLFT